MRPEESRRRQCQSWPFSRDISDPYPTSGIACELSRRRWPQLHTRVHPRRMREGLRNTRDSRWRTSLTAVAIAITFYTTWCSHLCYGSCEERKQAPTLNKVHLQRIRVDLRDTHDSHLAMPPMAVPIAITFCKTQQTYLHYGWLGVSAMALGGQQLRLRTSHRCNRGAAIPDCVSAPKGKYNNPEGSKVATRYDSGFPLSNLTASTWLDDQIGSLWGERAICANCIPFRQTSQRKPIANERLRICAHTTAYEEGFSECNGDDL